MKKLFTTLSALMLGLVGISAQTFTASDIIYDAPAGEVETYSRNCFSLMEYDKQPWGQNDYAAIVDITYCENGDVYIPNIISYEKHGAYLKGKKDGNKITIDFPQPITTDGANVIVAKRLIYDSGSLVPDPTTQTVTFNIGSNGVITMEGTGATSLRDAVIIGAVDPMNRWWKYLGDYSITYTPESAFPDKVTTAPEGLEFEDDWYFTHAENAYEVSVGFDGNWCYVKGLYPRLPESCIKGYYDEEAGTVTFPAQVYMGADRFKGYHIYLIGIVVDEEENQYLAEEMKMYIDPKREQMGAYEEHWTINYGNQASRVLEYWFNPYFRKSTAPAIYDSPVNVTNTVISPYGTEGLPYGAFQFDIVLKDKKNNVLNPERVSYLVFFDTDDLPYVFNTPEYKGLESSMMWVPYGFNGGTNHDFLANGATHTVFYYNQDAEYIGIAVCHDAPDGQKYYSQIRWNDGYTTDVPDLTKVDAITADVVSAEYFSLTGVKVNNPENGLYIKRERLSDGTYRAVKEIRK